MIRFEHLYEHIVMFIVKGVDVRKNAAHVQVCWLSRNILA